MKLLIHCDDVFDILTRGPFPSGHESDAAVEHHLRSCHDCRQLAEALRPAVELFHECLSDDEGRRLPEYHGEVTPLTQPFARRLPQTIAEVQLPPDCVPRHDHERARRRAMLMQGFVATALTAAAVLMMLSFGQSMRDLKPGFAGHKLPHRLVRFSTAESQEAARQLLALNLPTACWIDHKLGGATMEQQLAFALEQNQIACCSRCHQGTPEEPRKAHQLGTHQIATYAQSCVICHKS